jgi:hypothetical protein
MDNIIIDFDFTINGADQVLNNLVKMNMLTDEQVAAFKTANAVQQQTVNSQIDGTNKVVAAQDKNKKSIADLAKANQELTKTIPLQAMADTAKVVTTLGNEMASSEKKTVNYKAQLKAMTLQLVQMSIDGKEATDEFKKLTAQAAELKDEISDTQSRIKQLSQDTAKLDAGLQVLGGVASAYSVLQGSQALFGTNSKELEKTLVRLNAVMAIANGLQQLQSLFQKENIAVTLIANAQKKASAVATQLETAAESENIIVKGAATVAVRVLNAAMEANPVMLLVGGVLALTAAMYFLLGGMKSASEAQAELNDMQLRSIELNKAVDEQTRANSERKISYLEMEKANMIASGKSNKEIREVEKKIDQERVAAAELIFDKYEKERYALVQNNAELIRLKTNLAALQDKKASDDEIKALQGKIDVIKEKIAVATDAEKNYYAATNKLSTDALANETERRKQALTDAKALADARVMLQEAGSNAELKAKIAALQASARIELADVNKTEAEKQLIRVKFQQDVADLRRVYIQKQLEDERTAIQVNMAKSRQDAELQLTYQIEFAKKERDIALNQKDITDNAKLLAEQTYINKVHDLNIAYQQNQDKIELDIQTQHINKALALDQMYSEKTVKLQKQAMEIKMQQDIDNATATIQNTDQREAAIAAIIAKYQGDTLKLEKDYEKKREDATLALQVHEVTMDNIRLSGRRNVGDQILQNDIKIIDLQIKNNEDQHAQQLISDQDYVAKKLQLEEQRAQKEVEIEKQAQAMMNEARQKGFQLAGQIINDIFQTESDNRKAALDEEVARLDNEKNEKLKQANLTELQKKKIEDAYAAEQARVKLQAWKADQEAKVGQALINGFLGATETIAELGIPAGLVGAAAALAFAGVQAAAISAQKPPKFAKGVINLQGAGTETSDSIPAWLSKGESVVTAKATAQYAPILEAMNKGLPIVNYMPSPISNMGVNQNGDIVAMNEKVIASVLNEIKSAIGDMKQVHVSVDKEGIQVIHQKGNQRIEYVNQKYNG